MKKIDAAQYAKQGVHARKVMTEMRERAKSARPSCQKPMHEVAGSLECKSCGLTILE